MSETEPIERPMFGHIVGIVAIDATIKIVYIAIRGSTDRAAWSALTGGITEIAMSDLLLPKPPGRARGRPFEKGRSGNPGGRRRGSRNKATEVDPVGGTSDAGFLNGNATAPTC